MTYPKSYVNTKNKDNDPQDYKDYVLRCFWQVCTALGLKKETSVRRHMCRRRTAIMHNHVLDLVDIRALLTQAMVPPDSTKYIIRATDDKIYNQVVLDLYFYK